MSWHGAEDTWWQYKCPVTWCSAVTTETVVTIETLDDWGNRAFAGHGHPRSVPTCAKCRDIARVIDIVTGHGAARVVPGK